jgi:drug/metabolite transporter (DMT)-like permease
VEPPAAPALIWLALGAVYVIWGSTYLFIRIGIRTIPPFFMASIRYLVAGAVLYVLTIRRGDREGDRPTWRQWRAATIAGGLLLMGGNGGVVWAEQKVPIGIVAIVIAMVPIWIAVFDRLFFGQRLSTWAVVGLLLGFGGLVLLVGGPGHARLNGAGIAAAVAASLCWSVGSLYARRAPLPTRALVGTSMEMIAGGALLAVAGLVTGEVGRFHPAQVSAESMWAVAYLVVFGSWIGFASYVWLLRVAPTSLVATYAYVNPIIAVFLGWAFLNETLKARTLVAAAVIVAGVALIISARKVPPGEGRAFPRSRPPGEA